jgi:iron complex outermembrane receptor protein
MFCHLPAAAAGIATDPVEVSSARAEAGDLTSLSLEDLMNIEVTSTAKKGQKVADAAAAIYVIPGDEILRSGITSIPEALRLAPGIQVTRVGAASWAITSRGFNSLFAQWMLVLIDGRTVYSPLFAGVYWDVQDLPVEDIERIEVIRGPGAALWGANAVNGVINIITRKAKDTQGGLLTAGYGTEERAADTLQYGGAFGARGHYRVYGRYIRHDSTVEPSGVDSRDEWDGRRAGFRADWDLSARDALTLMGDTYGNHGPSVGSSASLTPPYSTPFDSQQASTGTDVVARWEHRHPGEGRTDLQIYHDRTSRTGPIFDQDRATSDLDFQHQMAARGGHEVIWGVGYRITSDEIGNGFEISFMPDSRRDNLFSAFAQDDISMAEGRFRLILGARLEHNDYTGFELQPDLRVLRKVGEHQTVWGAVSRAVRSPARADFGARDNLAAFPGPGGSTFLVSFFGNDLFVSEDVLAYQAGYRFHPADTFHVDLATFYSQYRNLRTIEPGVPFLETDPSPPHVVIPATVANNMDGVAYGAEVAANLRVSPQWDLDCSYTYFGLDLDPDSSSLDTTSIDLEGDSPRHQAQIRSELSLPKRFSVDNALYFVGRLENGGVPSHLRLDSQVAWMIRQGLEVSVGGQNLLESRHQESGGSIFLGTAAEIERNVYGKITWRF